MARAGAVIRGPEKKLGLAPEVCIWLITVEQTSSARVKEARRGWALIPVLKSSERWPSTSWMENLHFTVSSSRDSAYN